jgi:division protein 1
MIVGGDKQANFVGALQVFDAALASGTADGIVRLWDLRTGQVHRTLVGHTGAVTCLQFDDAHLVTGSLDRSIRVWDLRTGTISDAYAYDKGITSLHFDARRIVSSNGENTVKIYDRALEKHSTYGAGEVDPSAATVNYVRCREGYLVEGRQDGLVGVWAC